MSPRTALSAQQLIHLEIRPASAIPAPSNVAAGRSHRCYGYMAAWVSQQKQCWQHYAASDGCWQQQLPVVLRIRCCSQHCGWYTSVSKVLEGTFWNTGARRTCQLKLHHSKPCLEAQLSCKPAAPAAIVAGPPCTLYMLHALSLCMLLCCTCYAGMKCCWRCPLQPSG